MIIKEFNQKYEAIVVVNAVEKDHNNESEIGELIPHIKKVSAVVIYQKKNEYSKKAKEVVIESAFIKDMYKEIMRIEQEEVNLPKEDRLPF